MFESWVHTDIHTHTSHMKQIIFSQYKKKILSYESGNSRYFKTTEILKYWLFSEQQIVFHSKYI